MPELKEYLERLNTKPDLHRTQNLLKSLIADLTNAFTITETALYNRVAELRVDLSKSLSLLTERVKILEMRDCVTKADYNKLYIRVTELSDQIAKIDNTEKLQNTTPETNQKKGK